MRKTLVFRIVFHLHCLPANEARGLRVIDIVTNGQQWNLAQGQNDKRPPGLFHYTPPLASRHHIPSTRASVTAIGLGKLGLETSEPAGKTLWTNRGTCSHCQRCGWERREMKGWKKEVPLFSLPRLRGKEKGGSGHAVPINRNRVARLHRSNR